MAAGGALPALLANASERVPVHSARAAVLAGARQAAAVLGCGAADRQQLDSLSSSLGQRNIYQSEGADSFETVKAEFMDTLVAKQPANGC